MKKQTEKIKEIVEYSTVFTLIDDEYKNFSLDSIIKELQNCKRRGFDNLSYIISGNDYYGYNLEVQAIKRREETDEEFEFRLNQWKKLQQKNNKIKRDLSEKKQNMKD
jgi:hypothetical protein